MTPRETIYRALFDLVAKTPGLVTSTRRFRLWTDVAPADQPYMTQVQTGEQCISRPNLPNVWHFTVNIVLYGNNRGEDQSPMSDLNPIIDALVDLLNPVPPRGAQTLGGLVEATRIDGEIQTDEGTLGDQAVASIPVLIVVPQ